VYFFNDLRPHLGPAECDDLLNKIAALTGDLNWYDLYRKNYNLDTDFSNSDYTPATPENRTGRAIVGGEEKVYKRGFTMKEYSPWAIHPMVSDSLILGDAVSTYLNRDDVREALHIHQYAPAWEQCSDKVGEMYHYQNEGSLWIYKIMKENGIKMLHYSGDTDGAVPFQGTRKWIKSLDWKIL